jgi:hypothetical protein
MPIFKPKVVVAVVTTAAPPDLAISLWPVLILSPLRFSVKNVKISYLSHHISMPLPFHPLCFETHI